ncbi:MAG: 50S ribosomal protein L22 [Candidatus Colwellbacteria bacterium]|nr:50S ribosomal protein L22 [Candidatus Colwellbacteria bacterium]
MAENKVTAKLKNLDVTPRKVRRVTELLRGLQVDNALAELSLTRSRGAAPLTKLLQSAIANAKDRKMDPQKLVVSSIRVDEGRTLKRLLPQGRGRASLIKKRFSHVALELTESAKARPRGFVIPKKVKRVKEAPKEKRTRKPAMEEERGKPKEKRGFMQRVFSRKAV